MIPIVGNTMFCDAIARTIINLVVDFSSAKVNIFTHFVKICIKNSVSLNVNLLTFKRLFPYIVVNYQSYANLII